MTLIIIESVKPRSGEDVETILKNREDFWPSTLKSTPQFGGIDKLSNRAKTKSWALADCFHTSHPLGCTYNHALITM